MPKAKGGAVKGAKKTGAQNKKHRVDAKGKKPRAEKVARERRNSEQTQEFRGARHRDGGERGYREDRGGYGNRSESRGGEFRSRDEFGRKSRPAGGDRRTDRSGYGRDDRPRGGESRDDRGNRRFGEERDSRFNRDGQGSRNFDRGNRYERDSARGPRSYGRDDSRPRYSDDRREGRDSRRDDRFSRDDRKGGYSSREESRGGRGYREQADDRRGGYAPRGRGAEFGGERRGRDERRGGYGRPDAQGSRNFREGDRRDSGKRSFDSGRSERRDFRDGRADRGDRPRRDDRPDRFPRDDRSERPRRDDRGDRREDRREGRSGGWEERGGRERSGGHRPAHIAGAAYAHSRTGHDRPRDERPRRDRQHGQGWTPRNHDEFDYQESDLMDWEPSEAPEGQLVEVPEGLGFGELGVPKRLVNALAAKGISEPFPIQVATIPDALEGKNLLGRGQTGSGKTLAFGLPMITRIAAGPASNNPRGIILLPTRELAMQVADVISSLGTTMGLRTLLVAGGMPYPPQLRALSRGVDIIVATPGRLIDLIDQYAADLSEIQICVLDEADQMSDMGFMPEVTRILDLVPNEVQYLLYSATLDEAVDQVVARYLPGAIEHGVDPERSTVTTMHHHLLHVLPKDKLDVIAHVVNREGRTIVFVRTQMAADRISGQLRERGVMAGALHGGLTQGARSRVMRAFRNDSIPVLVATDVAARGIHVDGVSLVLQADVPHDDKDYLHRAGRTARAGEEGVVATVVLPHERRRMSRIADQAGVHVEPRRVASGDEWLSETAASSWPLVNDVIAEELYQELIAPRPTPRKSVGSRPPRRKFYDSNRPRRGH